MKVAEPDAPIALFVGLLVGLKRRLDAVDSGLVEMREAARVSLLAGTLQALHHNF